MKCINIQHIDCYCIIFTFHLKFEITKRPRWLNGHMSIRLYVEILSWELIFAYQHPLRNMNNQSTVRTTKRVASMIALTIVTLHNSINGADIACIWNSKYNVHVCNPNNVHVSDPNKCWFYISNTYSFCLLLILNCDNS